MKKDIFRLTIPGKPDYISVARLTSSAIASKIGFSLEEIEDIKVSLSEACVNALKRVDQINIEFLVDDTKFSVLVENVSSSCDGNEEVVRELEMGILIMESLMDEVNFNSKGVELIKYIKDGKK
ncbi:MAG: histidine kinase [Tissierellia bacterium]|nr:histidine kinase [Tissierellia bacterium]